MSKSTGISEMDSFATHPKNNSWKGEKELMKQIDDKIKSGKLKPGSPGSKVKIRKMTEEEKKKYSVR